MSELHWLRLRGGAVVADLELRKAVSRLIRIVQPDLVITQNPERNWDRIYAAHPDHLATGEAVVSAVYPDARNAKSFPELLAEGHQPHSVLRIWMMAGSPAANNLHVDISAQLERKINAGPRQPERAAGGRPAGHDPGVDGDQRRRIRNRVRRHGELPSRHHRVIGGAAGTRTSIARQPTAPTIADERRS